MKKDWLVFKILDWEEICAITIDGLMPGEIQATKELIAYEQHVSIDEITVSIERR